MKAFFVDLTLCTACRACQTTCTQWKGHPGEETNSWSSDEYKAITSTTYKLIHAEKAQNDGEKKIEWMYFPEQCRHCVDPPCLCVAEDVEGAVIHDTETGAVVFTEKTKAIDYSFIRQTCPYDIPKLRKDKAVIKCNMCNERVQAGKLPSCVEACPTGAMTFGDETPIKMLAQQRLKEVRAKYPQAHLGDIDSVRVIYLYPYIPAAKAFSKSKQSENKLGELSKHMGINNKTKHN